MVHLAALIPAGASNESLSISIHWDADTSAAEFDPRTFEVIPGRTVVVDGLELGESVEGAEVELTGRLSGCPSPDLRVQYETSVVVSNEGPHLDLSDWRHYTSDWRRPEQSAPGRFRLPVYREAERTRFPEVTATEIRQAVLAAGGEEWAHLTREVTGPLDPPASVGISRIRLGIGCGGNADAGTVFTIEFLIPLGC